MTELNLSNPLLGNIEIPKSKRRPGTSSYPDLSNNKTEVINSRKLSLPECQYFATTNRYIVAKTSSVSSVHQNVITEEEDYESEEEEEKERRKSHFHLPNFEPVNPKQRSHSITVNIPPKIEELEYIDVRDEILLMKDQFDKLLSVLCSSV